MDIHFYIAKFTTKFVIKLLLLYFLKINFKWTLDDKQPQTNLPFLYELTGDGPHTRARKDVSVKDTQLQVAFSLFQLFDHLMHKLEVTLTIADESIKGLRCQSCPGKTMISLVICYTTNSTVHSDRTGKTHLVDHHTAWCLLAPVCAAHSCPPLEPGEASSVVFPNTSCSHHLCTNTNNIQQLLAGDLLCCPK